MSPATTDGPRTLLDYITVTTKFFAAKGIDNARLDAELLLAHVLGITRTQAYTSFERLLALDEVNRFREVVRRRATREPVAFITGSREFWSMDFAVDRRVLVPRPETELLVELAVDALRTAGASSRFADVGTGSGAIAISVAKEMPEASVLATDRSVSALEVAAANAKTHGLDERINFCEGDGCDPLRDGAPFDVIASNPPYICRGEMAALPPEVRDWEPRWALESGETGMDVTAPLVEQAFDLLAPGGWLMIEVGTQAGLVRDCFVARGYDAVAVRRDLAGIDRVVVGRKAS